MKLPKKLVSSRFLSSYMGKHMHCLTLLKIWYKIYEVISYGLLFSISQSKVSRSQHNIYSTMWVGSMTLEYVNCIL